MKTITNGRLRKAVIGVAASSLSNVQPAIISTVIGDMPHANFWTELWQMGVGGKLGCSLFLKS